MRSAYYTEISISEETLPVQTHQMFPQVCFCCYVMECFQNWQHFKYHSRDVLTCGYLVTGRLAVYSEISFKNYATHAGCLGVIIISMKLTGNF